MRLLTLLLATCALYGAQTRVLDTMYYPTGAPVNGTLRISWSGWSIGGVTYPAGQINYAVVNGAVDVLLEPNPVGSPYTITYALENGSTQRSYWNVPTSATPVTIAAIKSDTGPAQVADYIIHPSRLAQGGASLGQALCWNGTSYSPGTCIGGGGGGGEIVVPGYGISKLGTTLSINLAETASYSTGGGAPANGASCAVGKFYFRSSDSSL